MTQMLCRGECGGASPIKYDPHRLDLFPDNLNSVDKRSCRNYRGSVLIIMEHRNIQLL